MSERHTELWNNLCSFIDFDGKGSIDSVGNMLVALLMLYTLSDEEVATFENPASLVLARRRHENMLGRYLRLSYGSELAEEKLKAIGGFVEMAKEFYDVHKLRVFT